MYEIKNSLLESYITQFLVPMYIITIWTQMVLAIFNHVFLYFYLLITK